MSIMQPGETSYNWHRLGSGVHSVVWRAQRFGNCEHDPPSFQGKNSPGPRLDPLETLRNWVAVKVVYDNHSMPPHDIEREAAILKRLSNPNIIDILDFVRGGTNAPYALYMPLIPLPLTDLLSSPLFTPVPITGPYSALAPPVLAMSHTPETVNPFLVVAKSLIYQLLLSISYIHALDPPLSHRDINPGNILIDYDGTVKIIDFGIAWTERRLQGDSYSELVSSQRSVHLFKDFRETPEQMCCQVATGPHRAPELLFSPPSYSAIAVDLWSLGTTIAQFFTPLQLISSTAPLSSPTSRTSSDVDTPISEPFAIPATLKRNIDYRATWERRTLFNGEMGELGLAWSVFQLRGTPNEETWPSFKSLPDVKKLEFCEASPKPLHQALPHLPSTCSLASELCTDISPATLIDALLVYPPPSRLAAIDALRHSWFSNGLLLPASHPGPNHLTSENGQSWLRTWEGRSLAEWLDPALKRGASRVTRTES